MGIPNQRVKDRLIALTTRPRRIHEHPLVLRPQSLHAFSETELFGTDRDRGDRILELGPGWGEFAIAWLQSHPADQYVAVEGKPERISSMVRRATRLGLERLRVLPLNFNWFLEEFFPAHSFDRIIINFPDPWPKRRHWKHRLIDARFPMRAENLLRAGGTIDIATDYGPYARRILRVFRDSPLFHSGYDFPHYRRRRPDDLPPTRFESIHTGEGKRPYYQTWIAATT